MHLDKLAERTLNVWIRLRCETELILAAFDSTLRCGTLFGADRSSQDLCGFRHR
jgi:hypothetical protein